MVYINTVIAEHIRIIEIIRKINDAIVLTAKLYPDALANGNKILFCGNGGSASDTQHLAGELVGRLKGDRCSLLAYFTGSKRNILSGLVLVGIYYNFKINKIPNFLIFISPFGMLAVFLTLLLLQGSFGDLVAAVSYLRDYAETTGLFLSRIDEFEPLWRYGLLSDL